MSASAATLAGARPTLAQIALVIALTLVLAGSARVAVPFWPVPMTLQTLAVLLIAGFAGPRIAAAAMLAYLAEGAAGLPVFATGGGLAYLAGPTGGYLAGMLLASVVVGVLVRRAAGDVLKLGLAMALGILVVYAMGAAWLSGFLGLQRALALGVAPFVVGDAVKATLAAALVLAAGRLRRA
jgi:biotin transport system substrate-specific component